MRVSWINPTILPGKKACYVDLFASGTLRWFVCKQLSNLVINWFYLGVLSSGIISARCRTHRHNAKHISPSTHFPLWHSKFGMTFFSNPTIICVIILREIASFKYITKSSSTFWKARIRHQTKYDKILFRLYNIYYLCEVVRDCCMQKQNMYVVVEKRNLSLKFWESRS